MEFARLIEIVGDEPVFETGLLLAGEDPADVNLQLSRATKAGRLYQLRRGLYALAPPYQKVKPHPFVVANALRQPSYVSLQSALAHYGLIPEAVQIVTSVTTRRPAHWDTGLGRYGFRHLKTEFFRGYRLLELVGRQQAFVATPEKALLDLVYLTPGADSPEYLGELRLENLDQLDLEALGRLVEASEKPKLRRAAAVIEEFARMEAEGFEPL